MTKREVRGTIVSHSIDLMPEFVRTYPNGDTHTKPRKLKAYVTVQIEGKKRLRLASRAEKPLTDALDPTPELTKKLVNTLLELHPLGSETVVDEYEQMEKGKLVQKYALREPLSA